MTCGLAYHGESGALNESISDVDKKPGKALRSLKAPGFPYDSTWMGGKDLSRRIIGITVIRAVMVVGCM